MRPGICKKFKNVTINIVRIHPQTPPPDPSWVHSQSSQNAGPVRFFIFFSLTIILLASLVAGRRLPYTAGAGQQGVLHYTYPLEYQICSSQPRHKSCWASSLRIQLLGVHLYIYLYRLWGVTSRGVGAGLVQALLILY